PAWPGRLGPVPALVQPPPGRSAPRSVPVWQRTHQLGPEPAERSPVLLLAELGRPATRPGLHSPVAGRSDTGPQHSGKQPRPDPARPARYSLVGVTFGSVEPSAVPASVGPGHR